MRGFAPTFRRVLPDGMGSTRTKFYTPFGEFFLHLQEMEANGLRWIYNSPVFSCLAARRFRTALQKPLFFAEIVLGKGMCHAYRFLLHACCLFPTTSFARRLESACGLALASSVTFRSIRPQAVAHFPSCASSSQQVHSFTSMNCMCSGLALLPSFSKAFCSARVRGSRAERSGRGSS